MSLRRTLLLIFGYGAGIACAIVLFLSVFNSDSFWLITGFQHSQNPNNTPGVVTQSLQPAQIVLPTPIDGTPLVAEKMICYDGAFIEDLTFEEVTNVAALLVRNNGTQPVLHTQITIERGNMAFVFAATYIPPDCSVLILEKDRKACRDGNFTALYGTAQVDTEKSVKEDVLKAEVSDMSMLAVTNTSDTTLNDVYIRYKNSYADGYFLIGGITHYVRIGTILPGQTLYLKPSYYAGKYSQIVHISHEKKHPLLQA